MTAADPIFVDATGNHYLVRDVAGAGDCALLALLHNPNFQAPVSGPDGLRRAIVAYARGDNRDACCTVYSLVGERTGVTFETYLNQVLQQGFWVGTVFFIWTTMCFGIDVHSHFFNSDFLPEFNSSSAFIANYLPTALAEVDDQKQPVHVLFHLYRNLLRCKPAMYNHFASLIPIPATSKMEQTLNKQIEIASKPWWNSVRDVNGYDLSSKNVKPKKEKGQLNKTERKQLNEAKTFHYLKNCDDGKRVNAEMTARLQDAEQKEEALALKLNCNVKDIDTGVRTSSDAEVHAERKVSKSRRLTDSYDNRNWLQRAKIVFLFLHPKIGAKNSADTAAFTGVNENTLLGWVYQKKMIAMWLDLVESMDAGTALEALPAPIKDMFSHVDPDSMVSVEKYRKQLNGGSSTNQLKILFKGGKVRA